MRAIWKGAVSFGLVSIGVKLYSATEEKDIRFHQVHRSDGGRIRYKRVCEACGEEVSYDDIAKGYDLGGGEMVLLTDEDFEDLPLSTSRAIDVLEFVPAEQVDPILYNKAYYLEPEGVSGKPYVLLREALIDSDRVAVVKVALRQREQLGTLRVRDGVLVLNTMLWPDEVRDAKFAFLDDDLTVRPQELQMAASLIDSMAGDFKPEAFTDEYREALQKVIESKVSGQEIVAAPVVEEAPTGAIDLMAALRASVDRARAARESGGAVAEHEPVAPTPITSAKSAKSAKSAPEASAKSASGTKKAGEKAGAKSAAAKEQVSKEQGSREHGSKTAASGSAASGSTASGSAASGSAASGTAASKKAAAPKKAPAKKAASAKTTAKATTAKASTKATAKKAAAQRTA